MKRMTWKEFFLFWLGLLTAIWGGFMFAAMLLVFFWFWVLTSIFNQQAFESGLFVFIPMFVSCFFVFISGCISVGPGSGTWWRPVKEERIKFIIISLILRAIPIALLIYVQANPGNHKSPAVSSNIPPSPPSLVEDDFEWFTWNNAFTLAALGIAPIFEILVLIDLSSKERLMASGNPGGEVDMRELETRDSKPQSA